VSEAKRDGAPCLIPVELILDSDEVTRGFITRLGEQTATISSDPVPPLGSRIGLRFRRPTDNKELDIQGEVSEMLAEGGLWRGRQAMLVQLGRSVDDVLPEDHGAEQRRSAQQQERRGSEPSRLGPSGASGLGGALQASGRGRRRRTQQPLVSESILETTEAPPVAAPATDPHVPTVAPEPFLAGPDQRTLSEQLDLGGELVVSDELPPIQNDDAAARWSPQPSGDQGEDDNFFGRFGGDASEHALPPVIEDEAPPVVSDTGPSVEAMLSTSTHPGVTTANSPLDESSNQQRLGPGVTRPQLPKVTVQPDDNAPPWEADGEDAGRSFIPRHVRIASSLEVTFWARGRSHTATAQNFSREGAFLAYPGDPPIRGAIVRIEFPIDWTGESLPVRFNAEVRWHRADQPGADVPEGFGVQILTFESPKDQSRYDEMLVLLLDLHPPDKDAPSGYRWGSPNRT